MEREIKFKVWDTKQNIFLEEVPSVEAWIGKEDWDDPEDASPYDWTSAPTHNGRLIWLQYTGLKDKNGKDIYDGDIIEYESHNKNKARSKVFYSDIQCPSVIEPIFGFEGKYSTPISLFHACKTGEIIGNIYENPILITDFKKLF